MKILKKIKNFFTITEPEVIVPVYFHINNVLRVDRTKNRLIICGYVQDNKGLVNYIECNYGDELILIGSGETIVKKILPQ